jgi:hypothetical protein
VSCAIAEISPDLTGRITSGARFRAVLSSLPLRFLVRCLLAESAQLIHAHIKSVVVSMQIFGRTNPMFSNEISV